MMKNVSLERKNHKSCRNYFFNPDYSDAAGALPPSGPPDQSSTNQFANLLDIGGTTGQSAMGQSADDMLLDIGDDEEGTLDMDPALRATDKDLEAMSLLTRKFVWLVTVFG